MSILKGRLRRLAADLYYTSPFCLRSLQGKVVILTYHRVLSHKELSEQYVQPGMYIHCDVFEQHIRFLKEYFQVLPFEQLLTMWANSDLNDRQRYCVITFDDGWVDNYRYAYPILKRYHLPATIFLVTGLVGTDHWFWPEKLSYLFKHAKGSTGNLTNAELMTLLGKKDPWFRGIECNGDNEKMDSMIELCKERTQGEIDDLLEKISTELSVKVPADRVLLNWEEVREMSGHDITFGSHSSTHRILTKLNSEEIRRELEGSRETLREKQVNDVPVFCYPNGNYSPEISSYVKAAGYQAAVTTKFGLENGFPQNLYGLRRVGVHQDICSTIPLFSFQISGLNNFRSVVT